MTDDAAAVPAEGGVGEKRAREEDPARASPRVRFSAAVEVVQCPAAPPLVPVRANDVTVLRFHSPDGETHEVPPTFTHQLFDEEMIQVAEGSAPAIAVDIHTDTLAHTVAVSGSFEDGERGEITRRLQPALPQSSPPLLHALPVDGTPVDEFTEGVDAFEIRLSTHRHAGACELLAACEKLALWFIETADAVDFRDEKWEALFLYRRGGAGRPWELAGYTTLYTFHNPVVGSKLRVCQALVLPRHQRRGMGRRLLRAVYGLCAAREVVAEMTVEDPALGFQRMRDAADVEWYLEHCCAQGGGLVIGYDGEKRRLTAELFSTNMPLEKIAKFLKITKSQAEFVVDALQHCLIVSREGDGSSEGADAVSVPEIKRWRLDAKRKLLKRFPELRHLSKPEMQQELDVLFKEHLERVQAAYRGRPVQSYLSAECSSIVAPPLRDGTSEV